MAKETIPPKGTSHSPTDSVRIVLFLGDTEQFLILQEKDDDSWKLPGGKFELGESVVQAARRELAEELGTKINPQQLVYAGKLTNDDGSSARYIFSVQVSERNIVPSSEIASVMFVQEDDIPVGKNQSHIISAVTLAKSISK